MNKHKQTPFYLDCNATTPIEPEVLEVVRFFLEDEFGNSGSRTHEFGARAKRAVENARGLIAAEFGAEKDEVIFTSGATESNNLAILGLREFGESNERMHVVTTAIEHKAVLEPCQRLEAAGFEVDFVAPKPSGAVLAEDVLSKVREDTLLVSVMGANNETGILQPIREIADGLPSAPYFHVDAAQTFGKEEGLCTDLRVDLCSVSAHKVFGPKGIGALLVRRRGFSRPPVSALMVGGGQERGLRPGTLPVHLVAGLGKAIEIAQRDRSLRMELVKKVRENLLFALSELDFHQHGEEELCQRHVLNFSIPGLDSEAAILALKGVAAVSNGSACTSSSYESSHVLTAMNLTQDQINGALRFSWSHLQDAIDWQQVVSSLVNML